jgi:hypothetical protein
MPARRDNREQGLAPGDRGQQRLLKVLSRRKRVDVHEDVFGAKRTRRLVVQAPGVALGVATSVADEDVERRIPHGEIDCMATAFVSDSAHN